MRSCILLLVGALAVSAAAVPRAVSGELAYAEGQYARDSASASRAESKAVVPDFGGPGWKRAAESADESKRNLVVDREVQGAGDDHPGQYKRGSDDVEAAAIDAPGRWKRDDDGEVETESQDGTGPPGWKHAPTLHAPGRWKRTEKAQFEHEGAGDHFGHSAWK